MNSSEVWSNNIQDVLDAVNPLIDSSAGFKGVVGDTIHHRGVAVTLSHHIYSTVLLNPEDFLLTPVEFVNQVLNRQLWAVYDETQEFVRMRPDATGVVFRAPDLHLPRGGTIKYNEIYFRWMIHPDNFGRSASTVSVLAGAA